MIIILIILIAGVAGALIASSKNRNPVLWGLACFLLPILILPAAMMPKKTRGARQDDGPTASRGAAAEY